MAMFTAQIIPMAERKYRLVPVDMIRVLNSRNREKTQFEDNVRSIDSIGLLKPIVVNERTLEKEGYYELICGEGRYLAHKQLGKDKIPAEVINCDKKTALLYSLVENIARVPPETMWYAREMKRMKDAGMSIQKIGDIVGKTTTYVSDFITLVEAGEDRLIKGVEQGLFSMAFAVIVAKSQSENVQHVLMDAFDNGIINSANATRVRNLIELRFNRGKQPFKKKEPSGKDIYSIKDLKRDITKATTEKERFVREASVRENRLLNLLDGLSSIWKDEVLTAILKEERFDEKPQLVGTYNV
jgi:ParB family chromosome partitioning protein